MRFQWSIAVLCVFSACPLLAQPDSREQEIQQQRQQKAKILKDDPVSRVESGLAYIQREKILERITAGIGGLRVKFGGLATGSGFAIGPEYFRRDLAGGNLILRASAASSFRAWQLYDFQLTAPRVAGQRVKLDFLAQHRNFAGINYYGPGPDSQKNGRSNFRLEDTSYDGTAEVSVWKSLKFVGSGGYLQVNTGPGTDNRFISSERIYGPQQAPGIDRQSDFLRGSIMAQWDYRDTPGGPKKGGNYYARLTGYSDRKLGLHDFRRLDLEVQQYIPFFNERRVIALRAKSSTTDVQRGQSVPFYLQPTLGGSDDLRGFRPFRFYDNNSTVFNAEYRWESFSGLDMAIFVDAGKVSSGRDRWNLKNLEGSAGFGFRFNVRNAVFMRMDFGFSHEGFQAWIKFNNVF